MERAASRRTLAVVTTGLAVLATGCGGEGSGPGPLTTTTADTTTTTAGAPCPATSRLKIRRVEEVIDVEVTSAYAEVFDDGGAGTVVLTLTNAPLDEAGARSDEVAALAAGQALVRMRVSNAAGGLETGSYRGFSNTTGDGKLVETASVYTAEGRMLPTEEHHLDITEITDDHVCGRIVPDDDDAAHYRAEFEAQRIGP